MLSEAKHPVPGLWHEIPFGHAQGRLLAPLAQHHTFQSDNVTLLQKPGF
jgi:hypothetical protein